MGHTHVPTLDTVTETLKVQNRFINEPVEAGQHEEQQGTLEVRKRFHRYEDRLDEIQDVPSHLQKFDSNHSLCLSLGGHLLVLTSKTFVFKIFFIKENIKETQAIEKNNLTHKS